MEKRPSWMFLVPVSFWFVWFVWFVWSNGYAYGRHEERRLTDRAAEDRAARIRALVNANKVIVLPTARTVG